MKKYWILVILSFLVHQVINAQFSSQETIKIYKEISPLNDTIYIVLYKGINPSTDLTALTDGLDKKWFKYNDLINPAVTGTTVIYSPDDLSGYVYEVDGKRFNVWIIDYTKHLPSLKAINPDPASADPCNELNLSIDANVDALYYKTPTNFSYPLIRNFKIKYATQKWGSDDWSTDTLKYDMTLPATTYTVVAPYKDTDFQIYGDQYATDLGYNTFIAKSDFYKAVAVKSHLKTIVSERVEKNENKRPQDDASLNYSAPFDVNFKSNPTSAVTYFTWKIYKDNQLLTTRNDQDQRFTFSDLGEYKVKLIVSNSTCSYADSVTVEANNRALIQVPNVFTPNGDGYNDEFRIAYQSLLSFECVIYNGWGRKIYTWTDPQRGWDGTIGGRKAAEGVYFYVIKASGYGLNPKSKNSRIPSSVVLKGNITLIRGGD